MLHFGIGLDFVRCAFLEDAAVVHHGHALDHAQRYIHVVFDDDVADMGGERGQDCYEIAPLGRRQACRRFVEQNEPWRAGKSECDFELPLLAVGQFSDQAIGDVFQMHERDEIRDGLHNAVAGACTDERERPRETPRQAR